MSVVSSIEPQSHSATLTPSIHTRTPLTVCFFQLSEAVKPLMKAQLITGNVFSLICALFTPRFAYAEFVQKLVRWLWKVWITMQPLKFPDMEIYRQLYPCMYVLGVVNALAYAKTTAMLVMPGVVNKLKMSQNAISKSGVSRYFSCHAVCHFIRCPGSAVTLA